MLVIFDTNIWLKELGLNTRVGSAVRYFLGVRNAKVVLPEVIKLETEKNLKKNLDNYISELERNHRKLLSVFGSLKELVLPSEEEIEQKVKSIFSDSKIDLIEKPFTLETARASLIKVIDGTPPNNPKDQQFKDGVIWADCVELLDRDDVYLVTGDRAFYQGRAPSNGLHNELKEEIEGKEFTLHIFEKLSSLLETIKLDVKLDELKLFEAFMSYYNERRLEHNIATRHDFFFSDRFTLDTKVFATENADELYVEFNFYVQCDDMTNNQRTGAFVTLPKKLVASI